eukprot:CAMPEP_0170511452 /NCGR_PEP_ID=MMETSP0208-20121228/66311_1 /TAXON_ID=197538 /ORGANISM="Strombidium inclinatum, Strain S3" /LENGTH=176 /DNA_ID=CAMNT_0010794995 /DNA_START=550 /DNA_END=1080 /DNA_ORIENTATION=+
MLEEQVQVDVGQLYGDEVQEDRNDPVGREQAQRHELLVEVLKQTGESQTPKLFQLFLMLNQTGQAQRKHGLELVLLHEGRQQEEGRYFTTVEEEHRSDEVHPLDVANVGFVVGESHEYPFEALLRLLRPEKLEVLEGPLQVLDHILLQLRGASLRSVDFDGVHFVVPQNVEFLLAR